MFEATLDPAQIHVTIRSILRLL